MQRCAGFESIVTNTCRAIRQGCENAGQHLPISAFCFVEHLGPCRAHTRSRSTCHAASPLLPPQRPTRQSPARRPARCRKPDKCENGQRVNVARCQLLSWLLDSLPQTAYPCGWRETHRDFRHRGTQDRALQHVRLELNQDLIGRHAPIHLHA